MNQEIKTFSELPLSADMLDTLRQGGFVTPTPVQAQAIPAALSGQDVVATAQTGTGKTLAFIVPILESLRQQASVATQKPTAAAGRTSVTALILSPTRELAMQIQDTFQRLAGRSGFRSALIVGGLSESVQLRDVRRGVHVLIATPGRLCDFLDRNLVQLSGTRTLVLDEADRMLDMGFLPSLKRILSVLPATRQNLFFSATIEKSVARLIEEHVKQPVARIAIGSVGKPADHVNLQLFEVEQNEKLDTLRQMLAQEPGSFLVFARTKHGTDRLAKGLSRVGVKAVAIHGDRTQSQRNRALDGFKQGQYRVLVATDVAARGIHVDNIAHVVNYDLPRAPEDFIHRIGRTGRAGERGTASTFTTQAERADVRKLERALQIRLVRQSLRREAVAV